MILQFFSGFTRVESAPLELKFGTRRSLNPTSVLQNYLHTNSKLSSFFIFCIKSCTKNTPRSGLPEEKGKDDGQSTADPTGNPRVPPGRPEVYRDVTRPSGEVVSVLRQYGRYGTG